MFCHSKFLSYCVAWIEIHCLLLVVRSLFTCDIYVTQFISRTGVGLFTSDQHNITELNELMQKYSLYCHGLSLDVVQSWKYRKACFRSFALLDRRSFEVTPSVCRLMEIWQGQKVKNRVFMNDLLSNWISTVTNVNFDDCSQMMCLAHPWIWLLWQRCSKLSKIPWIWKHRL